jgi:hypothetical protein
MIQGETMADTIITTMKASEKIKLNPLTPFSGKQNEFVLFMQDVYIYLKVNRYLYDNDNKKISFILSYLSGGDAAIGNSNLSRQRLKNMNKRKPKNRTGEPTKTL